MQCPLMFDCSCTFVLSISSNPTFDRINWRKDLRNDSVLHVSPRRYDYYDICSQRRTPFPFSMFTHLLPPLVIGLSGVGSCVTSDARLASPDSTPSHRILLCMGLDPRLKPHGSTSRTLKGRLPIHTSDR